MLRINLPVSVSPKNRGEYYKNFRLATAKTGRLMLMAADQKIEHLNDDFFGKGIAEDDASPEHLFEIAARSPIGVFAAHLGLIAQYGNDYRRLPYLIKLNGKTNLVKTSDQDPLSLALNNVEQILQFKKDSHLNIVGIGYTLYPGSAFENQMLVEAGKIIYEAHQAGLLAVLWIYPRGRAVKNEGDAHLAAGMAGLAACLGADFVKLSLPKNLTATKYKEIVKAAGRTGVIFSGGESTDPKKFLTNLETQIKYGARGNATGRNIHQKPLKEAVRFCQAIAAISLYGQNAKKAHEIYSGKQKFKK